MPCARFETFALFVEESANCSPLRRSPFPRLCQVLTRSLRKEHGEVDSDHDDKSRRREETDSERSRHSRNGRRVRQGLQQGRRQGDRQHVDVRRDAGRRRRQADQGRKAIEDEYAAFFKAHLHARMEVSVQSVEFPTPTMAIEDGISQVLTRDSAPPSAARYTAVHVLEDGKWLIATVRETGARRSFQLPSIARTGLGCRNLGIQFREYPQAVPPALDRQQELPRARFYCRTGWPTVDLGHAGHRMGSPFTTDRLVDVRFHRRIQHRSLVAAARRMAD